MRTAGLRRLGIGHLDRREDVGRDVRQPELRREHPDDRVGDAAECDRSAEDLAIAGELALPEPVRDRRHALASRHVVGLRKRAPEGGAGPERFEEVARDERGFELERLTIACQIEGHRRSAAHGGERAGRGAQVRELGGRQVPFQREQAGRLRVRKWREQDPLNHAENRRVGADPQSEGRYGRQREARTFSESPERVLQILSQSAHASSYVRLEGRHGESPQASRGDAGGGQPLGAADDLGHGDAGHRAQSMPELPRERAHPSLRSAVEGSMREARRAGSQQAASAAEARRSGTAKSVGRSKGCTS